MRRLIEHHCAGHEVLVGDAGGGDDQARGVDLRALVEIHPRLVHQHDLAVGVDPSGDLRRVGSGDTVQRHRAGRRLAESDALLAADVEALPVDRRPLAGLVDRVLLAVWLIAAVPATTGRPSGARSVPAGRGGQRQHQQRGACNAVLTSARGACGGRRRTASPRSREPCHAAPGRGPSHPATVLSEPASARASRKPPPFSAETPMPGVAAVRESVEPRQALEVDLDIARDLRAHAAAGRVDHRRMVGALVLPGLAPVVEQHRTGWRSQ